MESSQTPIIPIVDRKRWDEWDLWVEKNAQPKKDFTKEWKPRYTRFKKGVKTAEDWYNYRYWVRIAALPKAKQPHYPIPKRVKKRLEPKPFAKPVVNYPSGPSPFQLMLEHMKVFAKAPKRRCRNKYKYPKKEVFKFSPFILNGVDFAGQLKMKPTKRWKKMKPRPFHGITIPKTFLDREIEGRFFRDLRFPVIEKAFEYEPTKMMKALINPELHKAPRHCCPVCPPKYPLPRQRMRKCHWTWHLLHLQYLALPKPRLDPPEPCVPPRIKVPLSKLKKAFNRLAKPKYPPPKIIKDRCKKKRKKRPPKPKNKFVYKPFKKKKGQKPDMTRIKKLSEPKKKYDGPVKIVKDRDKRKRKRRKMKEDDFKWQKRPKPADKALEELFNRLSQPKPAECSKSETHDVGPVHPYTPNISASVRVVTQKRDCEK